MPRCRVRAGDAAALLPSAAASPGLASCAAASSYIPKLCTQPQRPNAVLEKYSNKILPSLLLWPSLEELSWQGTEFFFQYVRPESIFSLRKVEASVFLAALPVSWGYNLHCRDSCSQASVGGSSGTAARGVLGHQTLHRRCTPGAPVPSVPFLKLTGHQGRVAGRY